MLVENENLLNDGVYLEFKSISFIDENGKAPPTPGLETFVTKGRAYITNRRVILMSAQAGTNAELNTFGDVMKAREVQAGYSVSCCVSDARRFMAVAHKQLRSLSVHGSSSFRATKQVRATPNCWIRFLVGVFLVLGPILFVGFVFGGEDQHDGSPSTKDLIIGGIVCVSWWFVSLFGLWIAKMNKCCLRFWREHPGVNEKSDKMEIDIGAVLPPFNQTAIIRICPNPGSKHVFQLSASFIKQVQTLVADRLYEVA
jgi:hypothetical protein